MITNPRTAVTCIDHRKGSSLSSLSVQGDGHVKLCVNDTLSIGIVLRRVYSRSVPRPVSLFTQSIKPPLLFLLFLHHHRSLSLLPLAPLCYMSMLAMDPRYSQYYPSPGNDSPTQQHSRPQTQPYGRSSDSHQPSASPPYNYAHAQASLSGSGVPATSSYHHGNVSGFSQPHASTYHSPANALPPLQIAHGQGYSSRDVSRHDVPSGFAVPSLGMSSISSFRSSSATVSYSRYPPRPDSARSPFRRRPFPVVVGGAPTERQLGNCPPDSYSSPLRPPGELPPFPPRLSAPISVPVDAPHPDPGPDGTNIPRISLPHNPVPSPLRHDPRRRNDTPGILILATAGALLLRQVRQVVWASARQEAALREHSPAAGAHMPVLQQDVQPERLAEAPPGQRVRQGPRVQPVNR